MKKQHEFVGVAIGGRKCSGKDTVLDHLQMTRANVEVVRCKQPIVDEYLRLRNRIHDFTGYPIPPRDMHRADNEYIKQRDDADLIWFSSKVIRDREIGDPNICSRYLLARIPAIVDAGKIPVVPDMRRFEENGTLFSELAQIGYPMLCMKLDVPMDVLQARLVARDGDLKNWHPNDDTEAEVDDLNYHYQIDNSRDELRPLILQLETVLQRYPRLVRSAQPIDGTSTQVRVIDTNDGRFWKTGNVVERDGNLLHVRMHDDETDAWKAVPFLQTQLIPANGGCF